MLQHRLHYTLLICCNSFLIGRRTTILYEAVVALKNLLEMRLLSVARRALITCEATPLAIFIEALVSLLITKFLTLKNSSINIVNLLFFSLLSRFKSFNFRSKLNMLLVHKEIVNRIKYSFHLSNRLTSAFSVNQFMSRSAFLVLLLEVNFSISFLAFFGLLVLKFLHLGTQLLDLAETMIWTISLVSCEPNPRCLGCFLQDTKRTERFCF